jgi:hypothetical protein
MKKFNPQIGDTIVTKEEGNFICANYREYVENKGLTYIPEYASASICGVRDEGFNTWDKYGECGSVEFDIRRDYSSTKTRNQNYRRNLSGIQDQNS